MCIYLSLINHIFPCIFSSFFLIQKYKTLLLSYPFLPFLTLSFFLILFSLLLSPLSSLISRLSTHTRSRAARHASVRQSRGTKWPLWRTSVTGCVQLGNHSLRDVLLVSHGITKNRLYKQHERGEISCWV